MDTELDMNKYSGGPSSHSKLNKGGSQTSGRNVKGSISDSETLVTDLKSLKIGKEHLKCYAEEAAQHK